MISTPDRRRALELVEEIMAQGARQEKACEILGISAAPTSAGHGRAVSSQTVARKRLVRRRRTA